MSVLSNPPFPLGLDLVFDAAAVATVLGKSFGAQETWENLELQYPMVDLWSIYGQSMISLWLIYGAPELVKF